MIGFGQHEVLGIALPFVFLNRGASPLVITNLRLVVTGPGLSKLVFAFNTTATGLAREAAKSMAVPFHVLGNQAVTLVCEFVRLPGHPTFQVGRYKAEVEVLLHGSPRWVRAIQFELPVPAEAVQVIAEAGYLAIDADAELAGVAQRSPRLHFPLRAA